MRVIPTDPSGNIQQVQYDDDTQTLYITFNRGPVYTYQGVPQLTAEGFATSGMRPKANFNQSILNQYQYQRMS